MRISAGARKHGVTDDDMLHAARNAIAQSAEDDGVTMLAGPARNGALLEIGILGIGTDDPVIIHAMLARPKHIP